MRVVASCCPVLSDSPLCPCSLCCPNPPTWGGSPKFKPLQANPAAPSIMSNMLARMLDSMKEWARSERCMDAPGLGRHQENRNRGAMNKIAWVSATVLLVYLTGCCSVPSTKPLEGVAVSKVIDQIKQDLTNSSAANMKVG